MRNVQPRNLTEAGTGAAPTGSEIVSSWRRDLGIGRAGFVSGPTHSDSLRQGHVRRSTKVKLDIDRDLSHA
jgi:hypothetical protein